jgi:hypothetical protein
LVRNDMDVNEPGFPISYDMLFFVFSEFC